MIICLDCETTGLSHYFAEILQLAIIDGDGNTLFNKYIKPQRQRSWTQAQRVNGISPAMVENLPTIDTYKGEIERIFSAATLIVGYNLDFDLGFLAHAVHLPKIPEYDVMLEFAPIAGEWNDYYGDYKWQKLTTCAAHYNYQWPDGHAHDALADAHATLYCYRCMTK